MLAVCMALVVTGATGCKHKTAEPKVTTPTVKEPEQPAVKEKIFDPATDLALVYFDFDKSNLRPDAIETLNKNAEIIKKNSGVTIQIAGHCDERGTQEYNLALGERRALAVRDYLISLGIPADKLVTISYGKEQPVDAGHNEEAWAKNRRAAFNKAQ